MNWAEIVAIVMVVVRGVESILQWYNKDETKGVIAALWAIIKNFGTVETYQK